MTYNIATKIQILMKKILMKNVKNVIVKLELVAGKKYIMILIIYIMIIVNYIFVVIKVVTFL